MLYGSHNTGTFGTTQGCIQNITLPWIQTQTLNISEQLKAGIRYFDLRVSYLNEQVYISHTILMSNTLDEIMKSFSDYLIDNPNNPIIFIQLRVDYNDLQNRIVIQSFISTVLEKYYTLFLNENEITSDMLMTELPAPTPHSETNIINPNRSNKKIVLFCDNGTIINSLTISKWLMCKVQLFEKITITECENVFKNLEASFTSQPDPECGYIFPNNRALYFDYSSIWPLFITDNQQIAYKDTTIMNANISLIVGNNAETLNSFFKDA
jgi:hypothetical protein